MKVFQLEYNKALEFAAQKVYSSSIAEYIQDKNRCLGITGIKEYGLVHGCGAKVNNQPLVGTRKRQSRQKEPVALLPYLLVSHSGLLQNNLSVLTSQPILHFKNQMDLNPLMG